MKITLVIFVALVFPSSLMGQDSAERQPAHSQRAEKQPVPKEAAQARAAKLIKELYGGEWAAAKTSAQKEDLAIKLLDKGKESTGDPGGQFALFKVARDVALQAGDSHIAFEAIDALADEFTVDGVEMKTAALAKVVSVSQRPDQHMQSAEDAMAALDEAISHDNYTAAARLGEFALAEADETRDKDLRSRARGVIDAARKSASAFEVAEAAKATLGKNPLDAKANSIVGRYLCFVKRDWNGLSMLALGDDESMRLVAKLDLAGTASSTEQVRLGDAWWDLAEKQTGAVKKQCRARAGHWYEGALPGLSGLTKDKVQKRLQAEAPPPPARKSAPSLFRIINRNSGMCLCPRDGGTGKAQDVELLQVPLAPFTPDQAWKVDKVQGYCWIVNLKSDGCIAVAKASKNPGSGIWVPPKDPKALEQQWELKSLPGGYFEIINRNSGYCLAIPEGKKSAGQTACQFPFAGELDQQWRIEVAPDERKSKDLRRRKRGDIND